MPITTTSQEAFLILGLCAETIKHAAGLIKTIYDVIDCSAFFVMECTCNSNEVSGKSNHMCDTSL